MDLACVLDTNTAGSRNLLFFDLLSRMAVVLFLLTVFVFGSIQADYVSNQLCTRCHVCRQKSYLECIGNMAFMKAYKPRFFQFTYEILNFTDPVDIPVNIFTCHSMQRVVLIEIYAADYKICRSIQQTAETCVHKTDVVCYKNPGPPSETPVKPSITLATSDDIHTWIAPTVLCVCLFICNGILGVTMYCLHKRYQRFQNRYNVEGYDLANHFVQRYQQLSEIFDNDPAVIQPSSQEEQGGRRPSFIAN
jgi:hypothetical protein